LTTKEQLVGLVRIQGLAIEIRKASQIVESGPAKIEAIESRFRERNAEYVAVKHRAEELEEDRLRRQGEVELLTEKRKKYMDDLMQVKNQREYAAMLKEIDAVKSQLADHEDAILRDMEELEKLAEDLKARTEHIQKEREQVDSERALVEAESEAAQKLVDERSHERGGVESGMPATLLKTLRQLEANRQGVFLARADNGTCQSCYVRIRPQVLQEIRAGSVLHTCSGCKRFLYVEAALRPAGEGPPTQTASHG
jgi:uncharacterized protein